LLGNIETTIPTFISESHPPIGFVSCDRRPLLVGNAGAAAFSLPGKRMLMRVHMYFDDVDLLFQPPLRGELLAIEEFNAANPLVKIDRCGR
jgi:hypothetical protein